MIAWVLRTFSWCKPKRFNLFVLSLTPKAKPVSTCCHPRGSLSVELPVPWLPFLPTGSHNEEPAAPHCDAKKGRGVYASSPAEDRRESAEEGEEDEDEDEEEGREEEEEQRPLCSGVLGYPVVRDHTLGVGLSGAPEAQAEGNTQNQEYKGDSVLHSGSFK